MRVRERDCKGVMLYFSGNVILCMNLKCKGNCDNTLMRLDHTDNFSRNVCLWFHFLAFGDS